MTDATCKVCGHGNLWHRGTEMPSNPTAALIAVVDGTLPLEHRALFLLHSVADWDLSAQKWIGDSFSRSPADNFFWLDEEDLIRALMRQFPPNPIDGITVEVEDFGQGFVEFDIKRARIIAVRPVDDGLVGRVVRNGQCVIGGRIHLDDDRDYQAIHYDIIRVTHLAQQPDISDIDDMPGITRLLAELDSAGQSLSDLPPTPEEDEAFAALERKEASC